MSNGFYALIGVVLGGLVTLVAQGGLAWWQEKRNADAEWLVARRLLSEELYRLILDIDAMLNAAVIGEGFAAGGKQWFDTTLWEEYRPIAARHLP